jgi:hypothetical protein
MADEPGGRPAPPIRFPVSQTSPPRTPGGFRELGLTPLARQLALQEWQLNGHWCSRCKGIWYGYTLETQCPACGNRRG